ncbi:hypothetical protein Tsubulata_025237, partial [Turnera subulata]
MDLNNSVLLSRNGEFSKHDHFGDTTLSLNCLGYGLSSSTRFRSTESNSKVDFSTGPDDGCKLVLGLGPTPTAYSDDYYSVGADKTKGAAATAMAPRMLPESDSILKLGLSGDTKETFSGLDYSLSESNMNSNLLNQVLDDDERFLVPVVDEGSTSAKKSGGYMPSL